MNDDVFAVLLPPPVSWSCAISRRCVKNRAQTNSRPLPNLDVRQTAFDVLCADVPIWALHNIRPWAKWFGKLANEGRCCKLTFSPVTLFVAYTTVWGYISRRSKCAWPQNASKLLLICLGELVVWIFHFSFGKHFPFVSVKTLAKTPSIQMY